MMAKRIFTDKVIIRRAVLAAAVLLFSILQNTPGWFPQLAGVRALIIIPLVTSIAMYERDTAGMLYGLFAGALWDITARGNSFNAIFFLITGFVCGGLINTVMRCNFITHLLLTAAATVIYNTGYWLWHYVFAGLDMKITMLLRFYIPGMVYTLLLSPVVFWLVMLLERKLRD